jgi:hypothetical protein
MPMPLCTPFLLLLFYQLPRRALHPQLRVPSMRELKVPRQRRRALALWCSVYENRFQVEGSHLRVVVFRDFHGEEAVGGSVVGDER